MIFLTEYCKRKNLGFAKSACAMRFSPFNQYNICIDVFLILTKVIAESDILGVSFTDLSRLFTTRGFHIDKMV
jgi:hypothetical protein